MDEVAISRREAEVHGLVRENLTNAEIAARLYISERTVESHVSSLLRKLRASNRRELARRAPDAVDGAGRGAVAGPDLPPLLELLADAATFVGRERERELLRRQWQLARAGHTLVVVVSGEAGIGKSRLVSEFAAEVHAEGGRVLFGACYEDVDEPYGPFAQVISAELSELLGGDVTDPNLVFDAIESWLFARAANGPLLLVIEDLHWSTSSTQEVLRDLVRRAARQPVLVVATTRDTLPDLTTPVSRLLDGFERSPAVTRVPLGGLDPDDVAALLELSAADAASVVAVTGGNPLLVTHATDAGHSGSLRALLARREQLLDSDARAVLDLAATLGAEFDADVLAAGHGASLLSVLEALEHAEAAGLVKPLPGQLGRFGFVHALFRSTRYEQLTMRRRLELHGSATAALIPRADDDRVLPECARHACLAVPICDARTAVDLAQRAAVAAERSYAYDEAASHYRRALEAARSLDPPDPHTSLDLTVRLGAARYYHGDAQGLSQLLDAADRARREGDDEALVRIAMSFAPAGASGNFSGPNPAQLRVIEDALAVLGPEPTATRAHLLIELTGQIGDVRVEESVELAREAEAIAREIGDVDVLGRVLLTARLLGRHPSRMAEHERICRELEELGSVQRNLMLTLSALIGQAYICLERGDVRAWSSRVERFNAVLGDRSLRFFQLERTAAQVCRAFLDGDLGATDELVRELAPLAIALGHPPGIWTGGTRINVARARAADAEMLAALARTTPQGAFSIARFTLPAVQARVGAIDEALRSLAALRADGYPMPRSHGWTMAMTELAEAAEVANDPEAAAHVIAECAPYSGRLAMAGPCPNRPFDQALAQAALGVGDAGLAERYATDAVAASRERGTPLYLARELVFLAEARHRVGGATSEIAPLVEEAVALADQLGAGVVLVDLERYGLVT
jgi:DNA-binding CsgD family transcriptional regulator